MSKEKEIAYEFLENHLGSHITRSFSYTNPGIFEATINAVSQLQTERDLKIQNQNEWLESYRKKLESSERENKELKELLEKSQYNANGLFSEKETLISQLIDAHSQLSSLKEQVDKLEGALDNLTSKVNHILNTSNITEQQDRFNHLIDAYSRSFEALSTYKQSKGE